MNRAPGLLLRVGCLDQLSAGSAWANVLLPVACLDELGVEDRLSGSTMMTSV